MAVTAVTQSANDIQMDYMKLLVAQLQNQNPLEPLDNNQMASQLAQLSQLGQIENLNSKFADVLSTVQKSYASSLVGRQVSFASETEDGNSVLNSGVVDELITGTDGQIALRLSDNNVVGLADVLTVK
jgi:flagellar hook assembly protein FlgD